MAFIGMDEPPAIAQDSKMLGRMLRAPAKQQDVARQRVIERLFAAMPPRRFHQPVMPARLGPVGAIRPRQFRLAAIERAPHAPDQPETVATDALHRALMAIGRADPSHRLIERLLRHACHGTSAPPSNTPPSVT